MRDPERITSILAELERLWRESPDMRFGQLIVNATRATREPLLHLEDDALLRELKWRNEVGI